MAPRRRAIRVSDPRPDDGGGHALLAADQPTRDKVEDCLEEIMTTRRACIAGQ